MNPVLAYAIEHQAKARHLLIGYHRIPVSDIDDVAQDIIVRILTADPSDPPLSNPWKIRAYWSRTLQTAVIQYWRRSKRVPPLSHERPDPRQDPEAIICARETMRETWATARPAQRRAIIAVLTDPGTLSKSTNVNICRLRRRIRERAAV